MKSIYIIVSVMILTALSCSEKENKEISMLESGIAKYAETEIKYDESLLDDNQKIVVDKLYQAAKIIDELFLEQVYAKNFEIREQLRNSNIEIDNKLLEFFNINFGPFDRLDHDKPFIGNEKKPLGANYYPENITKEEFNTWIKNNPEDEKDFKSEFTIIKRDGNSLVAIPYSIEYKEELEKISTLMREAAEFADNETLKNYLLLRAKAFETNDYFESDMAWMDLKDHTIEIVIGPYEV